MAAVPSLLMLTRVPGIGIRRLRALIDHFHEPDAVWRATPRELCMVEGIERKLALAIATFRRGQAGVAAARFADDQCRRMERAQAHCLTLWDKEYPAALKSIYDAPPLLFVRGRLSPADALSLALVGTRSPSLYGTQAAGRLAVGLARLGITVVSGLARGIDTVAHAAAIKAGGRTIAVIGSGVDVLYPPENAPLAARITERGALLAEYPMGTKPDPGNFPRRNRIISGMSLGTIVVETAVDGGAMITAAAALEQNREVFAVPAAIREGHSSGANRLIHDGKALLIESVDDAIAELEPRLGGLLRSAAHPAETERPPLTLFEQGVFDAVPEEKPVHVDALARATRMPVAELLVHLLALECKGAIRQLPGKYFIRS